MILIIDNYDSFAYNLAQYLGETGAEILVRRNDMVTLDDIARLAPRYIIVSPGPCTPLEAGISNAVVATFRGRVPILGVCLGHQCIGQVYGGRVIRARLPVHGKQSLVYHDGQTLFHDLVSPLCAGRYHSLVVEAATLPAALETSARTAEGEIMGLRDPDGMVEGIQFHPESILTPHGRAILGNFLKFYGGG